MHRAVVVQAFIPNTQGGKGRQMFVLQGQPGIQSESQPARVCKETLSWKTKKQKQPITPPEKKKNIKCGIIDLAQKPGLLNNVIKT